MKSYLTKKGFSIRLLSLTITNLFSLVTAKDSPIYSIPELKGKRVSGNLPSPGLQANVETSLANANISRKEIIPVTVNSVVEGVKMVMDGRADAANVFLGLAIVEELNAKRGARILPMDPSPEAVSRMSKIFPGYMVKVKPGPGNTGIEKEQYMYALDSYLIMGEKVSNEAAYLVIKLLWENYKEFEKIHPLLFV